MLTTCYHLGHTHCLVTNQKVSKASYQSKSESANYTTTAATTNQGWSIRKEGLPSWTWRTSFQTAAARPPTAMVGACGRRGAREQEGSKEPPKVPFIRRRRQKTWRSLVLRERRGQGRRHRLYPNRGEEEWETGRKIEFMRVLCVCVGQVFNEPSPKNSAEQITNEILYSKKCSSL